MTRRRSIDIEGLPHDAPIPAACRIGQFVVSGGISGKDETGKCPPDLELQCALMFAHLRKVIEAAGGTTDDIIKLTVYMKDRTQRPAVNKEWLIMFPDPHSRPVRHTLEYDGLPQGMMVQCEFMAVLKD